MNVIRFRDLFAAALKINMEIVTLSFPNNMSDFPAIQLFFFILSDLDVTIFLGNSQIATLEFEAIYHINVTVWHYSVLKCMNRQNNLRLNEIVVAIVKSTTLLSPASCIRFSKPVSV